MSILKSLSKRNDPLSDPARQVSVLEKTGDVPFGERLYREGVPELKPTGIETFQVNVGKMCNQSCQHCHVDAGPDRQEVMTRETMKQCLTVLERSDISTVDITGGAPEMNPDFRWFVEECTALGKKVIVRCNLTIILANPKYYDLPDFYKNHKVEVVTSLPFYNADKTNRQRGKGVFEGSVKALKLLNNVGYGRNEELVLDLVYNPSGAFLPGSQDGLERQFKKVLKEEFDIDFNHLFTITNMPVSRYLEFLVKTGNYETYMEKLSDAFNLQAAKGVMCRDMISVSWDGYLYDCDFNQMLGLKVDAEGKHISEFNLEELNTRKIVFNNHCYGCAAGSGSSCGGNTA